MRKVYLDTTQADMCISVYVNDAEVVLAGASVNAMSVKHKNSGRSMKTSYFMEAGKNT